MLNAFFSLTAVKADAVIEQIRFMTYLILNADESADL
jgi:hypothetical protein